MNTELWRPVSGFEGYYEVSSLGRVRTVAQEYIREKGRRHKVRSRIRKVAKRSDGYPCLTLRLRMSIKLVRVHRLVALAFIPNPENKPQVNHKDGSRDNNRVENLEWATNGENVKHGYTFARRTRLMPKGEANCQSKLTDNLVREIRRIYSPRCPINGGAAIGRRLGLHRTLIPKIIRGEMWSHVR